MVQTTTFTRISMKLICFLITVLLLLPVFICTVNAEKREAPLIGVAWRRDQKAETFVAVCEALEEAGAIPVILDQVISSDLTYEDGILTDAIDQTGELSGEAVKMIRCNTWQGSNVEDVTEGIAAVVFPGGEDISPSLYYDPQTPENIEGYSPERDVSDFLLMNYCLEEDIPILAICRGMQMLSLVSGADIVQDITDYYEEQGIDYQYDHRNEPEKPGDYRDFAYHDVSVTDKDSLLYQITGMETITDVPSWHHQAVTSVDGTRLIVSGYTETDGLEIIEAVERPDKEFALGLQFHPEIDVVREGDEASLKYFTALINEAVDENE